MIPRDEAEDLGSISSRSSSRRSQSNPSAKHLDSSSDSSPGGQNSMFLDIFFLFVGKHHLGLELGTKKKICNKYGIKVTNFWRFQKKAKILEPMHIPILCGIISKAKFDFWNYLVRLVTLKKLKSLSLRGFEKLGDEARKKIVSKDLLKEIIEKLEQKFGFQTITLKPLLVNIRTKRYDKISFTVDDLTILNSKKDGQTKREEETLRLWIEMKGFKLPESKEEEPKPKPPKSGKRNFSDEDDSDYEEDTSKKQKARRPKKRKSDVPTPPKRTTPPAPPATLSLPGLSPREQETTRIRKTLHAFNNSEEGVEVALRFVANGFGMDVREAIRVLLLHTGKREFVSLEDMFKILAMHSMVLEAAKGR